MHKMPSAVCIAACFLCAGFLSSVLQAQEAPFDPNTDPRIDRREHPNAPHIVQPPSPLDIESETLATAAKNDPIFLEFGSWIQKYRLATEDKKPTLLAEGLTLAKTRRTALSELIKNNPKRALDWAISRENRAILPAEVLAQLETRVAGCFDYSVLITNTPISGAGTPNGPTPRPVSTITRYAVRDGKIFKAYVYGWRTGLTTKYNIPLQGVAVDNLLAIDINPARTLEVGETVPANAKIGNADKKCPLCGADFNEETGVVAQIGSLYYFFDSPTHLKRLAEGLIEIEKSIAGPKAGSLCDEPLDELVEQMKKADFFKSGVGAGNNGVPAKTF